MAVYKTSDSGLLTRREYTSFLAGNPKFIENSYESIATTTIGSGGAAFIEFSSIPQTYTHLQIRGISRADRSASFGTPLQLQFNSDTGSNYWQYHMLYGDGSVADSIVGNNTTQSVVGYSLGSTAIANTHAATIIDIVDYTSTNKYKVTRSFDGYDTNSTTGQITMVSSLWNSASAITSIKLFFAAGYNFLQYSQYALYGIKGN
jgi:hypothetical protein